MLDEKLKEITDKLENGIKELFESNNYKAYLSTMSKFHTYSVNNSILIYNQKPDATYVAGYKSWQSNFNRYVKKGEKAIRIIAPSPYTVKVEKDKLDAKTGKIVTDTDGIPQKEQVEIQRISFRIIPVFDISQTEGAELPSVANVLTGSVERYDDFLSSLLHSSPVPVNFEKIPGTSKGYFSPSLNRIAVQDGMSESQTIKTLIHEISHSMLHGNKTVKDRRTKEVEAESIAYTVCQHFGIDTSDYSFGYIAGWSSGKELHELKSSIETIRESASQLITSIEEQFQMMKTQIA